MGIYDLIFGEVIISLSARDSAKALNICMRYEIPHKAPTFFEDEFYIKMTKKNSVYFSNICGEKKIKYKIVDSGGAPELLRLCKERVGIFVGLVSCFLLVFFFSGVVWRVDVTGNENLSGSEVEEILNEHGFGVGSIIGRTDLKIIENSIMRDNGEIAWISVNMNGTVANVEIIESKSGKAKSKQSSNLVAKRDGKIERIEAYNGSVAVNVGDIVRAGEVLVGGVYESEQGEYRTTRAEGEVYARTVREITVEIPFETEEKRYTGKRRYNLYVNFFKKSIKIFGNSRNVSSDCDIIYKNGEVGLFSLPTIPIGYEKVIYEEYEKALVTVSENEAMERAFSVLKAELREISNEAELLFKDLSFEVTDSSYILNCKLELIENIAIEQKIDVG